VGYSVVNVEEVEKAGPGGAVRFVRRELGVQAFGINWYELAPNTRGREHDEVDTGQEEVNVVIEGSGVYEVEGESVPVKAGSFLRFDPETTRCRSQGPRVDDDRRRRAPRELRAARPVLSRFSASVR
jgi:quercetin dioxygenase-like cupin family protein